MWSSQRIVNFEIKWIKDPESNCIDYITVWILFLLIHILHVNKYLFVNTIAAKLFAKKTRQTLDSIVDIVYF